MADYIDRKAVYKAACKGCTKKGDEVGTCYADELCEGLHSAFVGAPTADVVEVVRCKDCKHSATDCVKNALLCNKKMLGMVRKEDFCSFGERRDNNAQTD